MPTISLPDDPSLDHLRGQARSLQRTANAGDPVARQRILALRPDHDGEVRLSLAQLVLAREYGFASWPRLRHHLDVIARYRRDPEPDGDDPFCRLACLNYTNDSPDRWAAARALLERDPRLIATSIWAAAVASDPAAVAGFLAADRTLARAEGGPYRLTALAYLAYSRLDPDVRVEPVLDTARILLRAGADPNAGYLWHGLPTPFTVLTGVLGEGELGPRHQPRHPHWYALARLLLAAGADPNDGQGLYNRMFVAGTEHLDLLFEYGLGTGDRRSVAGAAGRRAGPARADAAPAAELGAAQPPRRPGPAAGRARGGRADTRSPTAGPRLRWRPCPATRTSWPTSCRWARRPRGCPRRPR